MSTSLVYHAFGGKAYRYLRSEYVGGAVHLHVEKKESYRCCAACRSRVVISDGNETSTVKTLPIGRKAVFLVLHLKVLVCRKCGARRNESREVADPRKSYTRAFARFALDLLREMTMYAASVFLGVGWDLVKEILRTNLERRAERRSFRKVRRIAIDEFALRKGHNYMTVGDGDDYRSEGDPDQNPFKRRLGRAVRTHRDIGCHTFTRSENHDDRQSDSDREPAHACEAESCRDRDAPVDFGSERNGDQ